MTSHGYPGDYRIYKIISYVAGGLLLAVVLGALLGFLVQFLWNATLAEMFGLPAITFWQAFGLFVLAKLLFGFGGAGPGHDRRHKRARGRQRDSGPDEGNVPTEDESFRRFWQEEGRQAYQAFRERRQAPADDDV